MAVMMMAMAMTMVIKGGGEPSWAESAEDQADFQEDFLPLPHSFPQDHVPFDGS